MSKIRMAVLTIVLTTVACAAPCKTLKSAIDIGELGQPLVRDVCACLVVDPAAQAVCLSVASGYDFTLAAAQNIYSQYCSGNAKASLIDTSPAGFGAIFDSAGAKRK